MHVILTLRMFFFRKLTKFEGWYYVWATNETRRMDYIGPGEGLEVPKYPYTTKTVYVRKGLAFQEKIRKMLGNY